MKKTMKSVTEAIHAKKGDEHLFGVKALHVLIIKDGDGWFAQGLEIDYASAGSSVAEAKKTFETGLEKTVHEHLIMHGGIEKLLKVAPQEAWEEYNKTQPDCLKTAYSAVQFHTVKNKTLPFTGIQFIEQIEQLAA